MPGFGGSGFACGSLLFVEGFFALFGLVGGGDGGPDGEAEGKGRCQVSGSKGQGLKVKVIGGICG